MLQQQQQAVRFQWNTGPIDRQEEIDPNTGGSSKGSSNATGPGPALGPTTLNDDAGGKITTKLEHIL